MQNQTNTTGDSNDIPFSPNEIASLIMGAFGLIGGIAAATLVIIRYKSGISDRQDAKMKLASYYESGALRATFEGETGNKEDIIQDSSMKAENNNQNQEGAQGLLNTIMSYVGSKKTKIKIPDNDNEDVNNLSSMPPSPSVPLKRHSIISENGNETLINVQALQSTHLQIHKDNLDHNRHGDEIIANTRQEFFKGGLRAFVVVSGIKPEIGHKIFPTPRPMFEFEDEDTYSKGKEAQQTHINREGRHVIMHSRAVSLEDSKHKMSEPNKMKSKSSSYDSPASTRKNSTTDKTVSFSEMTKKREKAKEGEKSEKMIKGSSLSLIREEEDEFVNTKNETFIDVKCSGLAGVTANVSDGDLA